MTNNSELDNTIEQSKNIQLAMLAAKVNLGIVTELTEKYITRQLDEKQINSIKKALKEAVDFYTSINLYSTSNTDANIETKQDVTGNNETSN
jgi:signal recognition particle GTPase